MHIGSTELIADHRHDRDAVTSVVDRQLVFVRLLVAVYQRTGHLDVKVFANRRDEPALATIEQRGVLIVRVLEVSGAGDSSLNQRISAGIRAICAPTDRPRPDLGLASRVPLMSDETPKEEQDDEERI